MQPRLYQLEAMDALDRYLAEKDGNPCVVLPTGAGKTPTMAWTIRRYLEQWPATRVCVIAHIRELLEQGVEKMRAIWPQAPIGVFSAGLGSKDMGYAITYGGIQSIFRRACDFDPFDLIFVDEAHRIPLEQDGQYQRFIKDAKLVNPNVRVVGWTATPYRLAGGTICHPDYVLNEVCYEANVKNLIDDGFLCRLRTKVGKSEIDTAGIRKTRGDFNEKQLAARAMEDDTVSGIAREAVDILNRENRKACLFFCVTKDHAQAMSESLAGLGLEAPVIHADTPSGQRADLIRRFTAGQLRGLCNINVLSEGFDAQRIDAVVKIRPTLSKGLYYQQVGRGLRLHPDKTDCLILDFAGNVAKHGPIDQLEGHRPEMETCGECREHFPRPLGKCPGCGWIIPPAPPGEGKGPAPGGRIIPTDPKARTEAAILTGGGPWEMIVSEVTVKTHEKPDKPTSLCVTYHGTGGMESHREWVCLSHEGYAGHKARNWWRARFGEPVPASTEEALAGNLFLADAIREKTESILVRQAGRYTEVLSAKFRNQQSAAIAR